MNRSEKLRLSADAQQGAGFRQGLFVRLYEQSLYWFVTHVRPLKPMLERVKGGEPVIYGGLPVASFEKLLKEGGLQVDVTENGWQWRYAEQATGANEDFSGYEIWREALLAGPVIPAKAGIQKDGLDARLREHDGEKGRNILCEIRTFNLANSTPMQAMSAVAEWQEFLENKPSTEG